MFGQYVVYFPVPWNSLLLAGLGVEIKIVA